MGRMDRQDPMHFLPVAERFVSVNGEGPRSGQLAAFVRFVGCNLDCAWCDTRWACDVKCDCEWLDPFQIAQWVSETGARCVTLTGGEPLIHPIIGELLRMLVNGKGPKDIEFELPEDLVVEVETNGAVDLGKLRTLLRFLPEKQSSRIRFTVDYKLPSSGMEDRMELSTYANLRPCDAVKFVVADKADLLRMKEVACDLDLFGRVPIFVSPVADRIDPASVAQFLIDEKLVYARLQLQVHKILWPGVEKGV